MSSNQPVNIMQAKIVTSTEDALTQNRLSADFIQTAFTYREAVPETERLFHQHDVPINSQKRKIKTAITEPIVKKTVVEEIAASSAASTLITNTSSVGTLPSYSVESTSNKAVANTLVRNRTWKLSPSQTMVELTTEVLNKQFDVLSDHLDW